MSAISAKSRMKFAYFSFTFLVALMVVGILVFERNPNSTAAQTIFIGISTFATTGIYRIFKYYFPLPEALSNTEMIHQQRTEQTITSPDNTA